MANIIEYINKYGSVSFEESSFNEVDFLIFSSLSYIDFDGILDDEKNHKVPLQVAARDYFNRYTKKEIKNNVIGVQAAITIFSKIKDTLRYKDILLYNYSYKCDANKQFSALFIDFDKKNTYISFEGTDDLISGWKEDMALSYEFPVPAQREAIKYINRSIPLFSPRKYIVGGHSKGGNLALVASMYANPLIKSKIIKVISHDGPGLKEKQYNSKHYRSILPKFTLIIPNYSVVGLLLKHRTDYQVVLSNKKGIMSHNMLSWQISDSELVKANLSTYSKEIDEIITNWMNTYTDIERKRFVEEVFDIFERCNIDSLLDIKESTLPSLIKIIRESQKLDQESKDMIRHLIDFIIDYLKDDAGSFIQKTLHKNV